MYEAGIAMSGLSCFINVDLARDLANDIMSLVRSLLHIGTDQRERACSFRCHRPNPTFVNELFYCSTKSSWTIQMHWNRHFHAYEKNSKTPIQVCSKRKEACSINVCFDRCASSCCQCHLWISKTKPEELSSTSTHLLSSDDFIDEQLGSNQDH